MDLAYFAADALGVTFHQRQAELVASEIHRIYFGPWRIEMQIDADSDLLSGRALSFWVTLGKVVQAYLIVREKECWFLVLDATKLESLHAKGRITSSLLKERLVELKPAIVGAFQWEGSEWSNMRPGAMTIGG